MRMTCIGTELVEGHVIEDIAVRIDLTMSHDFNRFLH